MDVRIWIIRLLEFRSDDKLPIPKSRSSPGAVNRIEMTIEV